jgi:hypothetical protein
LADTCQARSTYMIIMAARQHTYTKEKKQAVEISTLTNFKPAQLMDLLASNIIAKISEPISHISQIKDDYISDKLAKIQLFGLTCMAATIFVAAVILYFRYRGTTNCCKKTQNQQTNNPLDHESGELSTSSSQPITEMQTTSDREEDLTTLGHTYRPSSPINIPEHKNRREIDRQLDWTNAHQLGQEEQQSQYQEHKVVYKNI